MQAQLSPSQPSQFQYHAHPPPTTQSTYQSNSIHQNGGTSSSTTYTSRQTNGTDMNPYQQQQQQQQYAAAGYGQYPAQQAQLQPNPNSQQSQQIHRSYLQQQTQLPPLVPAMAPVMGGVPVAKDDPGVNAAGSANPAQSSYMPVLSQPYIQSLPQQTLPASLPQAIAGASNQSQERQMTHSSARGGLRFTLEVIQQPQRARMCGFGDKDRRPITPPPCVRLVITEEGSGREIDVDELQSDPSFFVLQVDLWSEHADREANVVRASSTSPAVSISSATTTSYPPPAERPLVATDPRYVGMSSDGQHMYMPGFAVPMGMPGMPAGQYGANPYYPGMPPMPNQPMFAPPAQQSSAMYTRNLIGSLTVNAARLTDNEGKQGHWFVLQDLSVRTEGFFRLRMSFIDISAQGAPGLNRGRAAILAWTFSEPFQVYSAKKFPGVIESTPLSKCFASQGIKIPIRKDNKNDAQDDDDDGD